MKKSILSIVLLAAFAFVITPANAVVTSAVSQGNTKLSLPKEGSAKHDGWFHKDPGGLPGVDVKGVSTKVTSFQSLTKITKNTQWLKTLGGVDKNGVVVLKMNNMPKWVPGFHNQLGNFAFKKVGAEELYYGEWLARDGNINKDRVMYYAGNNKTEKMPIGGVAVYEVTGINKNTDMDREVLKGQFKADFAKNKLNGSISKTGLTVKVDAGIDKKDASFSGTALANGKVDGTTKGHFFGKDAAALAGYAKFNGNNQFDTAFGGTKK